MGQNKSFMVSVASLCFGEESPLGPEAEVPVVYLHGFFLCAALAQGQT